ncbi:MAG: hypothetical protein ACTSP4_08165 [Candidatus Hodarchaeales archaeon]
MKIQSKTTIILCAGALCLFLALYYNHFDLLLQLLPDVCKSGTAGVPLP